MNSKTNIIDFIENLEGINVETINTCNYSSIHTKCPILERYKKFGHSELNLKTIEKLFRELTELGFQGRIGLHHYSEPLLDKRIFHIIKMAGNLLPKGKINIWSNGLLLTQEIGEKLLQGGVAWLRLSAYTQREFKRLSNIVGNLKKKYPNVQYDVIEQELDDRMQVYTAEIINNTKPCWDIQDLLIINSQGELQLCCWDYLCKKRFGNINDNSLSEILTSSDYLQMRDVLMTGDRSRYDLCSRCWW